MHTITILLKGHSVHKQTSFRASRPFEDGFIGHWLKTFDISPKRTKTRPAMTNLRKLGAEVFFSYKNLWEKQISVWYGMVWSTNNSECMEAHVPAVNTVLAM